MCARASGELGRSDMARRDEADPSVAQDSEAARPIDNLALENGAAAGCTIFDRLVSGESDVVGLLAYSLSMQNKRDWLAAFQSEMGRAPTAAEMTAYDIGERIERRLATYRKLA